MSPSFMEMITFNPFKSGAIHVRYMEIVDDVVKASSEAISCDLGNEQTKALKRYRKHQADEDIAQR
jgi:hypothetical protein